MHNPYEVHFAKIKEIKREAHEIKLFTLEFKERNLKGKFEFVPGQFIEVGILGFGESPLAVCSSPKEPSSLQICVHRVGQVTSKLHRLKVGDEVTVRGPYGNGWPEARDKNLLLIGGGLGLIPLRSLILSKTEKSSKSKIQVFYGARGIPQLLFKSEYKKWDKFLDLQVTLDKPDPKWNGQVGLITTLFDKIEILRESVAFVCGPPIMYKFVVPKLKEKNFKDSQIYLSLERRMHCGIGVCQHCTVGSKYVCRDGPIFSFEELKEIPGAI